MSENSKGRQTVARVQRGEDLCDADELVRLMRAGDITALEQMTRCYGERLFVVGKRYCGDEELAKDAVQDAILTAGTKLADFRGDGSVEGWLVRMVANFCRRMHRGQKNASSLHVEFDAEIHGETTAESPADDAARGELLRILGDALLQLDPRDRVLVLLADAEGWKAPEIAQALDMTAAGVRTRLSRTRRRLRDQLSPLGDFGDD
ncbi:MAG: sigma-70 family RNA polymerase sigma factor [Proteobacteria bacterium]|nr:sigma-70 family RNA polymerase sigma factor [Pseudomonadota bacterium]